MDKFELLIKKAKSGLVIFVENRPDLNNELNVFEIITNNKLEKYKENILIVEDKENI